MRTTRRTFQRFHLLFLPFLIAVGAAALASMPAASLGQAAVSSAAPADAGRHLQSLPAQAALPAEEPPVEYAPGVVLVKLKGGALQAQGVAAAGEEDKGAAVAGLFGRYGVMAAEPLLAPPAGGGLAIQAASRGALADVYRLHLSPQFDARQMAGAIAADPNVEYAEPDYIARPARVPNDPEYAAQWALEKIGAAAAWDIQTGSPDVVIAVIDAGVELAHPEFAGRLWQNDDPVDGVDNDLNGYVDDTNGWSVVAGSADVADPNGHGTQVGGVIGAASNNGMGIAGLCWNCKLMFVNAMQASGAANYSDIARAVIYASSNGAQVINLSLGGYADSAALHEAIQEAATTAVIVAGAGNDDSSNPFYPAAYPQVLAIAATDQNDQKAVFSNGGSWVDLSAPGVDIRTTALGGYLTEGGTSLATAYVSGLAGLVKSQNAAWTPEQVKWQILNTAANINAANPGKAGRLGRGRIDAGAALSRTPQAQAAIRGYTIDDQGSARPAPGQSFQLVLAVQNQWLPAQNLRGTLVSSDPNVSIGDSTGVFGDIAPGQSADNSGDPFGVSVAGGAPYNADLSFTLRLRGDGGYSLNLPFRLQVRSAVETLGNTQYTQDAVWTNDKTYVLAGSIIVRDGVTLTIQPGAVIKANPDKFIRVDGTLIADGTAEQPIVFSTNSGDGALWSGIRFTPSAADAVYDAGGEYRSGSILRHVVIRDAVAGASLAGRAPYIAESTFERNSVGIATQADGAPGGLVRIERSRFTGSSIAAGGGATIVQNEFRAGPTGGGCAVNLSGGSPLIMQNAFDGVSCGIAGSAAYVQVISNTVRGGEIGLSLSTNSYGGSAPLPPLLKGPAAGQVAAGGDHTCSRLADGSAQCWGAGYAGQLGTGGNGQSYGPETIAGLSPVSQIAGGGAHTCAVLVDGGVQCWGYNSHGQLGTGDYDSISRPRAIIGLGGTSVQVATGISHSCVVLADGGVQCWGNNGSGQLGTGNSNGANRPQAVVELAGAVTQIAAGREHTCAVLADGGVQCWGYNDYGQLGTGNNDSANQPQAVVGLAGAVAQVAAGGGHTCAVLVDGRVQCWGYNGHGQLGTGSNNSADRPQHVVGLAGAVTQIAAGDSHTCAVLADGSVQCWGYNDYGQLGTGSNDSANRPQAVVALAGVAQAAAGAYHTCAVLQDGSTRCWGSGGNGQLGAGGAANANRPQQQAAGVHILGNAVQGRGLYLSTSLASLSIQQNSLADNAGAGITFSCDQCQAAIMSNTVVSSQGSGIVLGGRGLAAVRVRYNNLVANGAYDLYLSSGAAGSQNFTLDAANNFWGVAPGAVAGRIRDCSFDENGCGTASATVGKVTYRPLLGEPQPSAPAFVRSAVLDPTPVGLELGTLTVDFSRPMNTAILPSISFHDSRRGVTERAAAGEIWSAAEDGQGRLWFGARGKLLMFDGQDWMTKTVEACQDGLYIPYAAGNGDLWVGHSSCSSGIVLSRLRGTTWTTHTSSLAPGIYASAIKTIAEDGAGDLWFGTYSEGEIRFDGRTWRRYTVEDGLPSNSILRVVRDGQGRLWFMHPNSQGAIDLSVFDGSGWTTYGAADGFTFVDSDRCLFGDSQGRIWVCGGSADSLAGMFDGSRWTFFDNQSTGGVLQYGAAGFTEASDGSIWVRTNYWEGQWAVYRSGAWLRPTGVNFAGDGMLLFDRHNNFWAGSSALFVHWGGLDYLFENGRWLSPTRYQADYRFTAGVLPGTYLVEVAGAAGEDGLPTYEASSIIRVDFGGSISLHPPPAPAVQAQTDGALSNLSAAWQNGGAGVDQYRYAIGTSPGSRDVVGWTYLAGTSFTRNNLNLLPQQPYYVSVQARSTAGLWSAAGISNRVVAGTASAPILQPDTGGTQTAPVGSLETSLTVPPGAVDEPITVAMQPAADAPDTGGLAVLGQSFHVEAQTLSGAPVTQFAQPLTLVIRYEDADVIGLDESRLQIFFWNAAEAAWEAIPTTVDPEANTLTIQLDHLTLFAVLQTAPQEQKLYLPQISR